MAARRPRPADPAAAHEETNMWNGILVDLKRAREINTRSREVTRQAIEMETTLGRDPPITKIDEIAGLYREGVRLAEEEKKILHEEPCDVIKNLGLLQALRTASETEPPRNVQPPKSRNQKIKQKIDMDGAVDSPGPSPSIITSSKQKGSSVRSGSVPSTKDAGESAIKIEEGVGGSKGVSAEKVGRFSVGDEVAYKQVKMKEDGSQWIQCTIMSISETGNKKRIYEVQDPEPDENGAPGQVYKTSASALIAIPGPDATLNDYAVGKHVLARYPETTTFYRAEVTGVKKDSYRLKFEDDQNQEMEVARRFVLEFNGR